VKRRLEDFAEDVWGKALRGTGVSPETLAQSSGLPLERVQSVLAGVDDGEGIARTAPRLGLHPESMRRLVKEKEVSPPEPPSDLVSFTTPFPVPGYEEMTVNAYLAVAPEGGEAVAFDTGADARPMLDFLEAERLDLRCVLLTHAHGDHVAGKAALLAKAGQPPIHLHENERLAEARPFREGEKWEVAGLRVESRLTPGHSKGGTTYVLHGLSRPVAVVGDALFCHSQGGVPAAAYEEALAANRRNILSLPDATLLCPGHGPLTTVGEEKKWNPFYAEG